MATQKAVVGGEAVDGGPPKEHRERAGVQSLERGFAILEQIAQSREGIGLAELSKKVGLHNSTTFHLVKTMVSLGYIRQSKETKRYRIGRPLFTLAAGSLDEIELVSLATPILEDLSAATGESGHFAVRSGDSVVVIAKTSGTGAFQLTDRVGVVRPAHCTALGKVLLAALSPQQLERFIQGQELRSYTPKTITDPDLLRQDIAEVARTGVAFDDGEFSPEVRCVAVAVHDFTAQIVGALGISGPVWRLSIQVLQTKTELVKEAARRLSRDLGYRGQTAAAAPGKIAESV
jgi:IclR family transcriptional regulator, KDG regulon repressor